MRTRPAIRYRCLTYSGTFDHFHKGHEVMLKYATKIAEKVIIGLTTQTMAARKKLAEFIQPYNVRLGEIKIFLKENNLCRKVSVIPIRDKYGFAITNKELDSILVSTEFGPRKNALAINEARKKHGLPPLAIITHSFVSASNSRRISSYRIRAGDMLSDGTILSPDPIRKELFGIVTHTKKLPEELRRSLKKPFGRLFEGPPAEAGKDFIAWIKAKKYFKVVTIGDVVTRTLTSLGRPPNVFVIDYKTERQAIPTTYYPTDHTFHVKNPPASLTRSAVMALYFAMDLMGNAKIVVIGEEDLLTLPALILARPGMVVVYGQPNQGLVAAGYDLKMRRKAIEIIRKFEQGQVNELNQP
ncbi:MAG: pantetheine-phosphate adenylyltransferase [Candidatus Ranarchaeia archaeon]